MKSSASTVAVPPSCDGRFAPPWRAVGIGGSVDHLLSAMSYASTTASACVGSSPPTATTRPSMNVAP